MRQRMNNNKYKILKSIMRVNNMTINDIGKITGISISHLSQLINGNIDYIKNKSKKFRLNTFIQDQKIAYLNNLKLLKKDYQLFDK